MQEVYNNKNYKVILNVTDYGDNDVTNYDVINKEYSTVEQRQAILPAAIEVANQLSEALDRVTDTPEVPELRPVLN